MQLHPREKRSACPNSQILWNYFTISHFSIQTHRKRDGEADILICGIQKKVLLNGSKDRVLRVKNAG